MRAGIRCTSAVLAVGMGLLAMAPAAAQVQATLSLDPTSVLPGDQVKVHGEGFGDQAIHLRLDSETGPVLAGGISPQRGIFDAGFTVGAATPPGAHSVLACYEVRNIVTCQARAALTVRVPATTTPRPSTTPSRPTTTPPLVSTTEPGRDTRPPVATTPTTGPGLGVATTTSTTSGIDQLGVPTTEATIPPGPGDLAGQTTTTGLGLGELSGGDIPDLVVTGMEVTQSVQNLDNEMPLVGGRTTIVRVYLRTFGGSMANVSGAIQADPSSGPPVVVLPDNGPITVTPDGSDRLDVDSTLQFTLPPEATAAGETELLAFAYGGAPSSPAEFEPIEGNNYEYRSVDFMPATSLAIRVFPVHDHAIANDQTSADDTLGVNGLADAFLFGGIVPAAYRYQPLSEIVILPGTTLFPLAHHADNAEFPLLMQHWDPVIPGSMAAYNSALMDVWEQSTPASDFEQFYGVFRDQPSDWGGLSNATVANGKVSLDTDDDAPWYQTTGGKTMIHEIAHNFGFKHNLCQGDEEAGGAIEPYPYSGPPCVIAPEDPGGWYGFDVAWQAYAELDGPGVMSNSPSVGDPFRAYPVMGYANPRWADPFFWCRMLEFYGIECTELPIPENDADVGDGVFGSGDPAPAQGVEVDGWVRLSAVGHLDSGEVDLIDTRRVADPLPHAVEEYRRRRGVGSFFAIPHEVEIVDGNGSTLLRAPLQALDTPDHPPEGPAVPEETLLSELVRWPAEAAEIRVLVGGELAATRVVSASVPEVAVTGVSVDGDRPTVAWSASDADGDELRFNLAYSPDAGQTWVAMALSVSGSSYTHPDPLPGGPSAVIRVEASDGVHTARAVSQPFAMPDRSPELSIFSPADGAELGTRNVELRSSAWDLEDGPEDPPVVAWRSDRDGDLGTGRAVTARLAPGRHLVSATATDSSGQSTTAEVTFTVLGDGEDDPEVVAELEAILAVGIPGESGAGAGRVVFVVVAGLVGVAAVGLWRRHRRVSSATAGDG